MDDTPEYSKGRNMPRIQRIRGNVRWAGAIAALCLVSLCGLQAPEALALEGLHGSVYRLDVGDTEKLLRGGADVNRRDSDGKTPLFYCIYPVAEPKKGARERIMRLLLDRGADVNAADRNGVTILMESLAYRNTGAAGLLIARGASVKARDGKGSTALHRAAGFAGADFVKLLVDRGCDVNWRDRGGWTPLHEAAEQGNPEVVEFLIRSGADVNVENEEKNRPLHLAALEDNAPSVGLLIRAGSDIAAENIDGNTALHLAVHEAGLPIVTALLDAGAPVNGVNRDGLTPLHRAAFFGLEDIAEALLDRGALMTGSQRRGITPLHLAARWGHAGTVRLLAEKGADAGARTAPEFGAETPLHLAARYGHADTVRFLLELGVPYDRKDGEGMTPLDRALEASSPETASLLRACPFRGAPFHFVLVAPAAKGDVYATGSFSAGRRVYGPERAFDGNGTTFWLTDGNRGPAGEKIAFYAKEVPAELRIQQADATGLPRRFRPGRIARMNLYLYRADRMDYERYGARFRMGDLVCRKELQFNKRGNSVIALGEYLPAGAPGGFLVILEIVEMQRRDDRTAGIAEIRAYR